REGDQVRVGDLLRAPCRLHALRELAPTLIENVHAHRAEARCRWDLETFLHVLDQRRSRSSQRDGSRWRLRGGGQGGGFLLLLLRRSNFPSPACGGGQGGGLLPLDRLNDIATTDRAAGAAPLDARQVHALRLREQLGALGHLDPGCCGTTIGRRTGSRFPSAACGGGQGGGCFRRRRCRGGLLGRPVAISADRDLGECRTDRNRLPRLGEDLHQSPARGRRDFGIHLVGGDLNQPFAFA